MEKYRSTLSEGEIPYPEAPSVERRTLHLSRRSVAPLPCYIHFPFTINIYFTKIGKNKMIATMQDSKYENQLFLTPRVPQGLAAAVEGLTREVIRQRPENIYVFAAHHFENLLKLREQYDYVGVNNNKKSAKVLRDVNDAIKERQACTDSRNGNDVAEPSGWSLNETAKVLERHRSIFGETGQKMSTEQVRELANEATLRSAKISISSPKRKSEEVPRTSVRGSSNRKRETQNFSKTDSKHVPKIISQIPIAKDIKTELKKNRISSRERKKIEEKKMQVACEYSRETTIQKTVKKSVEQTKRSSYESRSEQRKSWRTEESSSSKRKTETNVDKVQHSPKAKKTTSTSRSVSMDSVKNFVVQNLAGMASLDELQSPSYVEKVQEVIDETSTIIQEKLEALKTGVRKASRKHSKMERMSGSDDSKDSDKSASQRSREENLSSEKSVQENSENSEGNVQDSKEQSPEPESKNSEHSDSSGDSKISLPAVRPTSSKSTSRSQSARSDSGGLILPPISPESAKSPKVKEELVLPVLSPPRSSVASPEVSLDAINLNEKNEKLSRANSIEEYHDSLNVTPDLLDAPPRPDSLENPELLELGGQSSPLETLKDKLVEIEQVQKRIEGVLDDTISNEDKSQLRESSANEEAAVTTLNIQDKLLEIQESEKRIEQILDSQSAVAEVESTSANSDIKSKLQELAEAEKRVENIFINKANDEPSKETAAKLTNVGVDSSSDKKIDDPEESRRNNTSEKIFERNLTPEISNVKQDKSEETPTTKRLISPHSYILTEGSPYEIPDSVTTVIIPDRTPSPDSDTLQIELDNDQVRSTLISSREEHQSKAESEEKKNDFHEAFGEPVKTVQVETSIVEDDFIRGIKETHDLIIPRKDLDLIKEEREREVNDTEVIDSEDEKVLKVVTTSLEEILEKDEVEYVTKEEVETAIVRNAGKDEADDLSPDVANPAGYESTDETKETSITDAFVENTDVVENSLDIEETTERSAESTNEIKETSIATDRSTLSFDPAIPIVPELNLDSLPDVTISSFNITDEEQKDENKSKRSSSSENLLSSDSAKYHLSLDNKVIEEKGLTDYDVHRENDSKTTAIKSTADHEKIVTENRNESTSHQTQDNISSTEIKVVEEKDVARNHSEDKKELDHSVAENITSDIFENKVSLIADRDSKNETIDNSMVKEEIEKEVISSAIKHEEIINNETVESTIIVEEDVKKMNISDHTIVKEKEIEIKSDEAVESLLAEDKEIKNDEFMKTAPVTEKDIEKDETIDKDKETTQVSETSSVKEKEKEKERKNDASTESLLVEKKEITKDESIKTESITEKEIKKEEKIEQISSLKENKNDIQSVETSSVKKEAIKQEGTIVDFISVENKIEKNETEDTKIHEKEIKKNETIENETIKEENVELESKKNEKFEEIINDSSEHTVKYVTIENKETKTISSKISNLLNESVTTDVTEQSVITEEIQSSEISHSSGETHEKEERSNSVLASQSVSLAHTGDDAKSCTRQVDATEEIVEQKRLGVIDNDESSQLADSSRASSQCTNTGRLYSDDPSIKANTGASAQRSNQSEDANQTIAEMKSSNQDFRAADGATVAMEDQTEQPEEKRHYHIYVPEMSTSKDVSSSSESSTFMSAATKIQAGVRGFLTRRRLQSTQRRSSTLDSVPSIQESFAVETLEGEDAATATTNGLPSSSSLLQPPVQNGSFMSEVKARKKLRREDAVQRTTLSVENAFAENQLQHTGEFHDCIPLPVFDSEALSLKLDRASAPSPASTQHSEDKPQAVAVEQLLEKMLLERGPAPFVDVLLLPGDPESMLQSRYLNFITSVEDVANELFSDPLLPPDPTKGLIIEEITSLDENKFNELTSTTENQSTASKESSEQTADQTENESSAAPEVTGAPESKRELSEKEEAVSLTSDVSINIEEVLDLGDEDASLPKTNRLLNRVTGGDPARSSSLSQESHLSEQERTRSPVTMMQIAPKSVEEKSDKSERSSHSSELLAEAGSTTAKEDTSTEEKEQESPNAMKTNEPDASSS